MADEVNEHIPNSVLIHSDTDIHALSYGVKPHNLPGVSSNLIGEPDFTRIRSQPRGRVLVNVPSLAG